MHRFKTAGKSVPNFIWLKVAEKFGAKVRNCRKICAKFYLVAGKCGAYFQNCREMPSKFHLALSRRKRFKTARIFVPNFIWLLM